MNAKPNITHDEQRENNLHDACSVNSVNYESGEDYVQATKVNWLKVFGSLSQKAIRPINGGNDE
ncbi:hypothetical protein [Acinetobacter guillouiae]|uniref:hypothetical protein n=1 Tax=Acinetobacter guillouiae TaxID=106649 RepID=UPI003342ABFD